jgi:hypothetical protein
MRAFLLKGTARPRTHEEQKKAPAPKRRGFVLPVGDSCPNAEQNQDEQEDAPGGHDERPMALNFPNSR